MVGILMSFRRIQDPGSRIQDFPLILVSMLNQANHVHVTHRLNVLNHINQTEFFLRMFLYVPMPHKLLHLQDHLRPPQLM